MAEKKGKEKGPTAIYLKLSAIGDLARALAGERSQILAVKAAKGYSLMCEAEHLGDARIVLQLQAERIGRYLVYSNDEDAGERIEIVDDVTQRGDHYKSQRIPIVEVEKAPYLLAKKVKITPLEVKELEALVRAIVNGTDEEEVPRAYSFPMGGKRAIGTLSLINGGEKVFAYAKAPSKEPSTTISYDYNSDTIEFPKKVGGALKIYIKLINLAERPQFLD